MASIQTRQKTVDHHIQSKYALRDIHQFLQLLRDLQMHEGGLQKQKLK